MRRQTIWRREAERALLQSMPRNTSIEYTVITGDTRKVRGDRKPSALMPDGHRGNAFFLLCKSRTRSSRAGKIVVGQKNVSPCANVPNKYTENPLNPRKAGLDDDAFHSRSYRLRLSDPLWLVTPKRSLNGIIEWKLLLYKICNKKII